MSNVPKSILDAADKAKRDIVFGNARYETALRGLLRVINDARNAAPPESDGIRRTLRGDPIIGEGDTR